MSEHKATREQRLEEVRQLRRRVAELEQREADRRQAEGVRDFLTGLLEATPDLVAFRAIDPAAHSIVGPASYLNRAGRAMLGIGPAEQVALIDYRPEWARRRILEEAVPAALRDGLWRGETAFRARDGREVPVSQVLIAHRTPQGEVAFVSTIARDLTETRRLEEQFRQAQKMEVIGRLAGGVAHDFNNLLTIIAGYSELLLGSLPAGDPARGPVTEIRKAGERAAELTRRLLAFGRVQILRPAVLDLNALVADLGEMLRRVLGDDIVLSARLDPALGPVVADPGQVQQVLLNLAVNARDAMPTGGELVIETRNAGPDEARRRHAELRPGPYAVLTVRDTGCGMDEATRAHLFEPFFTTKDVGRGTGLGLAMVYGTVKQSGGHIDVESAPGRGTAFTICLPQTGEPPEVQPGPAAGRAGAATVLVVEPDDTVRALARLVLRDSGYTVVEARDGREAVDFCTGYRGAIHLLVTALVMPRMSGRELAQQLLPRCPGIRVLYLSDAASGGQDPGGSGTNEAVLQRPFAPAALATRVRDLLGR